MLVPGTERMVRYPDDHNASMRKYLGVESYGTSMINGYRAYKVGRAYRRQLETVGWRCIKEGTGYCYMVKD